MNPILLEFLMESLSPLWFQHLSLAEVVFCFLFSMSAANIVSVFLRCHRPSRERDDKGKVVWGNEKYGHPYLQVLYCLRPKGNN